MPLGRTLTTTTPTESVSSELPESGLVSEGRQRAWRWFILLALGLLIIEGLVAMRLSRLNRSAPSTP